jgi:hypothetical protein
MWLAFEVLVIIACVALGLRRKSAAPTFLAVLAGSLILVGLISGRNPVGLLTSFGGWMILDGILVLALFIANDSRG